MAKIDYKMLGEQIRYIRNQLHLSQEHLAELCDISPSFMGHIERGTRKMSMETFVSIADALNVSTDYLLHYFYGRYLRTSIPQIQANKQQTESL